MQCSASLSTAIAQPMAVPEKMAPVRYPNANRSALRNHRNRRDALIVSRHATTLLRRDLICGNKQPYNPSGRSRQQDVLAAIAIVQRSTADAAMSLHAHRTDVLARTDPAPAPETQHGSASRLNPPNRWAATDFGFLANQKKEALQFARPFLVR